MSKNKKKNNKYTKGLISNIDFDIRSNKKRKKQKRAMKVDAVHQMTSTGKASAIAAGGVALFGVLYKVAKDQFDIVDKL